MPGLTITFTTDFGLDDWFVGTMKGIVTGMAPGSSMIDITHQITRGDIWGGAFALAASAHYFPSGTIHIAVVDPGVGSSRVAILIGAGKQLFVGPDNGVLSLAVRDSEIEFIHSLENRRFFRPDVSRTFHGRDIFAPVAAHLANGAMPSDFGPRLSTFIKLDWPRPTRSGSCFCGEVIYVDRFGNAITNLGTDELSGCGTDSHLSIRSCDVPIREYYQAVPTGHPVAVLGSTGLIEIAINGGDASHDLNLARGSEVVLAPDE
jgi:S-adenosylmethionine hydrolase